MANKDIFVFDPKTKNDEIFNRLRYEATDEFRRRIPEATQADLSAQLKALNNYTPSWNEFIPAIINKVGLTIQRSRNWTNPLAIFKRGLLEFGESIEEINTGLVKAYVFDEHVLYGEEMLFGREYPEVQADYHKRNRKNIYKITVDTVSLKRAFLSETGLSEFINQLMEAPTVSDNLDEYLLMRRLFREYEDNGGFFKIHIPVIPENVDSRVQARQALRAIKAAKGQLNFLSHNYNAARMPVHAQGKQLHLFTTPEFNAALDVEGLATLFGVSYAEVDARVTLIDRFDIPEIQAILTTEDFFVVADTYYDTTSQANAAGLHENFFLHHHQIISASRFVPAIAFTNGEGTTIVDDDTVIDGVGTVSVKLAATGTEATNVLRGSWYKVDVPVETDPETGDNYGIVYTLAGQNSSRTHIDSQGHLFVHETDDTEEITVGGYAVGAPEHSATTTLAVVGTLVRYWPNPGVDDDEDADGLYEVTPKEPNRAGNNVTIPSVKGVQYKNGTTNVNNDTVIPIVDGTPLVINAEARAGSELVAGAPATWTFTYQA